MLRLSGKCAPQGVSLKLPVAIERQSRRPFLLGSMATRATVASLAFALSGCTFILDFDRPIEDINSDAAVDATVIDATKPLADAMAAAPDANNVANCTLSEPNDTLATAQPVSPGTLAAAICPSNDLDFYSFTINDNQTVSITLSFDPILSDLNLRVYNINGMPVASSLGTSSVEEIVRGPATANALPAGDYRMEVNSYSLVAAGYELSLAVE